MDYKIIDDIIPPSYQNHINNLINAKEFPWYFGQSINYNPNKLKYEDPNITDAPGFGHLILDPETGQQNSPMYPHILPVLFFLEQNTGIVVDQVKRIRVRRTIPVTGHTLEKYTPAHVDLSQSEEYKSLVYYVEDSDGDTVLFDTEYNEENGDTVIFTDTKKQIVRVPPKKGRGFFFKGKVFHSGNCPVNYKQRTIINFDFTIK